MASLSEQQFCLRWNNFQSNIISAFEYLRSEEDFVDVTLACEGRSLKAHKVILSACSQYFRELLKTTPCQHPIIVLKDVCYEDLLSLMCFVYQGVVYIGQDRLTQFLKTAEFLQIKGLSEQNMSDAFGDSTPSCSMRPPSSQNTSGTLPALNPISAEARTACASVSDLSPPFSSAHSSPAPSPAPRSDHSASTAVPHQQHRQQQQQPSSTNGRRKPIRPLHAIVPVDESSQPSHSTEPLAETSAVSRPVHENGSSNDNGNISTSGSDEIANCQEVALSLVSETSILRQRIESCSPQEVIKKENNGSSSPAPLLTVVKGEISPGFVIDPANSISMAGREAMGFPFLPQPGTSSLLSNNVSNSQDEQMNSPNSPRYRQRWRCMQPSVCPHCLRTFSNAFNLKQHIINVHTFGNELKCDVCGKVQKNKWYLRKHMVKSHNAPLRRVKLPDGTMINTE